MRKILIQLFCTTKEDTTVLFIYTCSCFCTLTIPYDFSTHLRMVDIYINYHKHIHKQ